MYRSEPPSTFPERIADLRRRGIAFDSEGTIHFHEDTRNLSGFPFMWSFAALDSGLAWFRWNKTREDQALNAVELLQSGRPVIAHNLKHDYKAAKAQGIQLDFENSHCSMSWFKTVRPDAMTASLKGFDVGEYIENTAHASDILDSWFETKRQSSKKSILSFLSFFRKATKHKWPYLKDINDLTLTDVPHFLADPRFDESPQTRAGLAIALVEYHADKDYAEVPAEVMEPYAVEDAIRTRQLVIKVTDDCPEDLWPVMHNESKTAMVLAEMEWRGVNIDKAWCEKTVQELEPKIEVLSDLVNDLAGEIVDIYSPLKMRELLYNKMNYPVFGVTDSGLPAVDSFCLAMIGSPLTRTIAECRLSLKVKDYLKNQFVANTRLNSEGHWIIHPSFQQATAITRRLSCKEPNLQNVMRNETTKRFGLPNIRRAFITRPGWNTYKIDYQQMEMVATAEYSNEPALVNTINAHGDVHDVLAYDLFQTVRVPEESPEYEAFKIYRLISKTMQFGTIYGMGRRGFIRNYTEQLFSMIASFTPAMVPTEDQAREYLTLYFSKRPRVADFRDKVGEAMRSRGWIHDLFGQRYVLRDRDKSYVAINYLIQGFCAQWVKHVMVRAWEKILRHRRDEVNMLLQVHDELWFEIIDGKENEILPQLVEVMTSFNSLLKHVRMSVEVSKFQPLVEANAIDEGPACWAGAKKVKEAIQ
jgi:DNA polymerase I-like protein with 3'-5' exonuclease and polymerase domains